MIIDYDKGTSYWATDYDDTWIFDVAQFISYASPEERQKIKERIETYVAKHDSYFVVDGYVDRSLAVDCHQGSFWGKHYLYVWLDRNGMPFYAGRSNDFVRPWTCKTGRSEKFKAKIAEGGCHCVLVAKNIHSGDISYLEQDLIAYLVYQGYELVNTQAVPSQGELVLWDMFRGYTTEEDVKKAFRRSASLEKILSSYIEWQGRLCGIAPIIEVLNKVIGAKWDGETATLERKEKPKAKTIVYNGVEKTYGEWAKEPYVKVGGATIQKRIEKHGWSVEDALLTPPITKIPVSSEERGRIFASYSDKAI
jgi:hypothetical protein